MEVFILAGGLIYMLLMTMLSLSHSFCDQLMSIWDWYTISKTSSQWERSKMYVGWKILNLIQADRLACMDCLRWTNCLIESFSWLQNLIFTQWSHYPNLMDIFIISNTLAGDVFISLSLVHCFQSSLKLGTMDWHFENYLPLTLEGKT